MSEARSALQRYRQYAEGDIITFGHFEQDGNKANGPEPIQWRILKMDGDRMLVISEYGLASKPVVGDYYGKEETWENSLLRSWLNVDFYNNSIVTITDRPSLRL